MIVDDHHANLLLIHFCVLLELRLDRQKSSAQALEERLEGEVRAELELTHAAQRGDSSADDVGNLAAVRAVDAGIRILEIDMVESVAGIGLDGQLHLFVDSEALA
jgi:hypothetical protein